MCMMTGEQYVESIRSLKLKVYLFGEKLENPVDNPILRPSPNSVKATYDLAHRPEHEDLLTVESHLTGERINHGSRVIILHETSIEYTAEEQKFLSDKLELFIENGIGIIYITSKWDGILENVDRVAVMRDGQCVKMFWERPSTQEVVQNYIYGYVGDIKSPEINDSTAQNERESPIQVAGMTLARGQFLAIFDSDGTSGAFIKGFLEESECSGLKCALIKSNSVDADWIGGMTAIDNLLLPISSRICRFGGHIPANIKRVYIGECKERFGLSNEIMNMPISLIPKRERLYLLLYRWELRKADIYFFCSPELEFNLLEKELLHKEMQTLLLRGVRVIYLTSDLRESLHLVKKAIKLAEGKLCPEESQ